MPKTAGNSLKLVLEEHFGDAMISDYLDFPMNVAPRERHRQAIKGGTAVAEAEAGLRHIRCVHGHFLPIKYLLLADLRPAVFTAWLREPVARLISHYHYWFDAYDPDAFDTRPLHRRVVEEQWSLEKFCLSEELRNLYSQYLWGFPLERFDFVGIMEHYESDLREFSLAYLDSELPARSVNVRQSPRPGTEELDLETRARVEAWHAADVALYQRALATREVRLGGGG